MVVVVVGGAGKMIPTLDPTTAVVVWWWEEKFHQHTYQIHSHKMSGPSPQFLGMLTSNPATRRTLVVVEVVLKTDL